MKATLVILGTVTAVLALRVVQLERELGAVQRELDNRYGILRHAVEEGGRLDDRLDAVERAMNGELPAIAGDWSDVVRLGGVK